MEKIIKEFCEVLCKYKKYFTADAVGQNILAWANSKNTLLNLLRRHPNWNEDALALVFSVREKREIDPAVVNLRQYEMYRISNTQCVSYDSRRAFQNALGIAASANSAVISALTSERVFNVSGVKCAAGQKTSRAINKLCKEFGVDKHPEYNAVFAQLADALSPLEVKKTALLSLHPCDFLEMSSTSNSWTSCHNLSDGAYKAGCLSYLLDATSMIFYTVDDDITAPYYRAPRRNRQVFCYSDGLLIQSRLYPDDTDEKAVKRYRIIVQTAIALCGGVPNEWELKRSRDKYYITAKYSMQYPDYANYGSVSALQNVELGSGVVIGAPPICVCCGNPLEKAGSIKCGCEDYVVCTECGETTEAHRAIYNDSLWWCNECMHTCEICGQNTRDALLHAVNKRGEELHICAECHSVADTACSVCGIRSVCGMVGGNRSCVRAYMGLLAITPEAVNEAAPVTTRDAAPVTTPATTIEAQQTAA